MSALSPKTDSAVQLGMCATGQQRTSVLLHHLAELGRLVAAQDTVDLGRQLLCMGTGLGVTDSRCE
jgi:hypothetical protein